MAGLSNIFGGGDDGFDHSTPSAESGEDNAYAPTPDEEAGSGQPDPSAGSSDGLNSDFFHSPHDFTVADDGGM